MFTRIKGNDNLDISFSVISVISLIYNLIQKIWTSILNLKNNGEECLLDMNDQKN